MQKTKNGHLYEMLLTLYEMLYISGILNTHNSFICPLGKSVFPKIRETFPADR